MREMRKGSERRLKPTPLFNRYLFKGKRTGHRRAGDLQHSVYVDRFESIEWGAISLLLSLCSADAFLTIIHLSNGFQELNPILNGFYRYGGPAWFMAIKSGLTLPGAIMLFMLIKTPLAKKGMKVLVVIYSILIMYQLIPWWFAI